MNKLSTLLLATLIACGGGSSTKQTTPAGGGGTSITGTGVTAPTPNGAPELPLWPEVKKGVLPNGLTYYILKRAKPEKRALLWLAVNAGSTLEDDDQQGLAHFIEHMEFNGTKRFPKAAIVNYIETIGMAFGADLNAETNFDNTTYKLTVPTDKPEYVGKGLDILRDWAGDASFEPDELEKERGVVIEEWRGNRNVQMRLFQKHMKVLFEGTKYATRLPIGLPEILKSAKRERLTSFYKDFYRPDLMAVIAVGDVDPAQLEKEIQAKFGDLKNPSPEKPRAMAGVPKASGVRVSIETDKEVPVSIVEIDNVFPHRPEATEADYHRSVVEQLYAMIVNERLATLAKDSAAPFGGAQVAPQSFVRDIDLFSRIAIAKTGKVEDTIRLMMTEAVRIEKFGVTQAELDRARTNMTAIYEQNAAEENTEDATSYVEEITRNFYEHEFMIGRSAEFALAKKHLPTITLDEMNKFAKTVGGADNRVVQISGPDASNLPSKEKVLQIAKEVEASKLEPWKEASSNVVLMKEPPKAGKVVKEKKVDAIGVTEWTLSNGARVILRPTDYEAESISISGDSPGGLAMADAKQWPNARFADDVAGLGGVADIDADTLGKVLAGKRAAVSASISETQESIDAGGSMKDVETIFQLIYLKMTAPRRDPAVFAAWQQNTAEALENQRNNPETEFSIESNDVLWKKNPRRGTPTADDIKKVDIDKAVDFYKSRFGDATDFTFVIVGQFDVEKLKPLVETYLASLPAKGRKEKEKDINIRRITGSLVKTWNLGHEPKAAVRAMYYGDDKWSRDKERDLFILSQVLDIRLREILREDMSGTYGVGVGGFFTRSPNQTRTFQIQFGCAPDAADKLLKAAQDDIVKLGKEGPTSEQLEKVKETWLREREVGLKTNGFWANWLATSYRYNDDPTLVNDPSKMLARFTPENVKAAVKEFLPAKSYYQSVMMPEGATAAPAATPAKGAAPAKAPAPAKTN
ncbi:MAG TPA: insulinase family protein [Kofleriaceae bacterium]